MPSLVPSANATLPLVSQVPVGQPATRKLFFLPSRVNLRPTRRSNLVTEPEPPAIRGTFVAMRRPKRPRSMRVILALVTIAVGAGTLT